MNHENLRLVRDWADREVKRRERATKLRDLAVPFLTNFTAVDDILITAEVNARAATIRAERGAANLSTSLEEVTDVHDRVLTATRTRTELFRALLERVESK